MKRFLLLEKYIRTQAIAIGTEYKKLLTNTYFLLSSFFGYALLEFAYWFTKESAIIATHMASNPVGDIVHNNIPRIDTSIVHGELSFVLFDLRYPIMLIFLRYFPFATKALALIILLRAVVINLTHLGIPDGAIPIVSGITFGGDLFFSGHVANVTMLSLVFWHIKPLRYFFVAAATVFGVSAVLGRYHYTIDVVAAPFFAYGVFVLAKKLFEKDYLMSRNAQ
jgi:membrane-associated phospholipid phosphatase